MDTVFRIIAAASVTWGLSGCVLVAALDDRHPLDRLLALLDRIGGRNAR
ncbi:hypothetical protein [Streptomyces scopuliridis]|uniref:Uncharacterized protein n=1 Tax=Streptomyces scopuliridis TaxID=452529 RepID=A0ACD4ZPJ1_9ACTN|nr:hypothetical protein [Streptomyces scopuliridis]WSC00115.1 hypothetical protein OG835_26025 [Streptomyces scopuliridis]